MRDPIVLVVILVMVLALIAAANRRFAARPQGTWPFYAKKPLSAPEQVLYFRLSRSLPDHIVLAQVSLSRLLGVKKGNNFRAWQNRINRMSADFVVCSKDSSVISVIELDDSSHGRADRKAADAKKDKALNSAGVRVIRWQVRSLPDEASIRAEFHAQPDAPADGPLAAPAAELGR